MVRRDPEVHPEEGFFQQMIDALVFSLAVYESSPEKILAVLRLKYDLPVGALEVFLMYSLEQEHDSCVSQPTVVGRSAHGYHVVACRGTSDLADVVQDLKFLPRRLKPFNGAAHMGFVERAECINVEPLLEILAGQGKIIFTGHSLGGAVSALLCLRVMSEAKARDICLKKGQVRCITFGAPLFANSALARIINDEYHEIFCQVVSRHDIVPRILPLVSLAQRLLGTGPSDFSGALELGKLALTALEMAMKISFAGFFQSLNSWIPWPLRTMIGSGLKLLWPRGSDRDYRFAGNFLFLDPEAHKEENAICMVKAEELNFVGSEMAFALGFNMVALTHHGLSMYQAGLVKGVQSKVLARISRVVPGRNHRSSAMSQFGQESQPQHVGWANSPERTEDSSISLTSEAADCEWERRQSSRSESEHSSRCEQPHQSESFEDSAEGSYCSGRECVVHRPQKPVAAQKAWLGAFGLLFKTVHHVSKHKKAPSLFSFVTSAVKFALCWML